MLGAEKGTDGAEGSRAGHQRWPILCPDIQLSFACLKLNSHPTLVKARVEPDRPQRSQCQGPTGGTQPQSQETEQWAQSQRGFWLILLLVRTSVGNEQLGDSRRRGLKQPGARGNKILGHDGEGGHGTVTARQNQGVGCQPG